MTSARWNEPSSANRRTSARPALAAGSAGRSYVVSLPYDSASMICPSARKIAIRSPALPRPFEKPPGGHHATPSGTFACAPATTITPPGRSVSAGSSTVPWLSAMSRPASDAGSAPRFAISIHSKSASFPGSDGSA